MPIPVWSIHCIKCGRLCGQIEAVGRFSIFTSRAIKQWNIFQYFSNYSAMTSTTMIIFKRVVTSNGLQINDWWHYLPSELLKPSRHDFDSTRHLTQSLVLKCLALPVSEPQGYIPQVYPKSKWKKYGKTPVTIRTAKVQSGKWITRTSSERMSRSVWDPNQRGHVSGTVNRSVLPCPLLSI